MEESHSVVDFLVNLLLIVHEVDGVGRKATGLVGIAEKSGSKRSLCEARFVFEEGCEFHYILIHVINPGHYQLAAWIDHNTRTIQSVIEYQHFPQFLIDVLKQDCPGHPLNAQ